MFGFLSWKDQWPFPKMKISPWTPSSISSWIQTRIRDKERIPLVYEGSSLRNESPGQEVYVYFGISKQVKINHVSTFCLILYSFHHSSAWPGRILPFPWHHSSPAKRYPKKPTFIWSTTWLNSYQESFPRPTIATAIYKSDHSTVNASISALWYKYLLLITVFQPWQVKS